MRKFLIAILLAGAAGSPAFAQDQNDNGHHHDRSNYGRTEQEQQRPQQQQQRSFNPQRGQGPGYAAFHGEAPQQSPQFVRQQPVQVEQGQRSINPQHFEGPSYVVPRREAPQQSYRGYVGGFNGRAQPQQAQTWTGQHADGNGERGSWNGQRDGWNGGRTPWNGQRAVNQQQLSAENRFAGRSWNRDWRNDRRYDWRRYRDQHRSVFRLGIYYDPFGYGYQPFDIGFRLMPVYYGQQFWIDPAMYELPYPPPGTQWVRYWDDALLVDMYSGQVVDVIHNFFW